MEGKLYQIPTIPLSLRYNLILKKLKPFQAVTALHAVCIFLFKCITNFNWKYR